MINDYFTNKSKSESEIQQNINKVSLILDEYYKEKKNINFLFTKIHKDSTINNLEEQIKTFEKSIKIFNNAIKLLTKYDQL